jgi:uncharacterized protein YcfJ
MKYVFLCLILASCMTNKGTGAISGCVIGAGAGSLVNNQGTWIGTAAGALAGSLIGAILDEQDRKVMERNSPRTVDRMDRGEPLTINDVIKLSQGGVSDDTIIRYMREAGTIYTLTQAQVRRLQDAGVSQRVINEMIDTGN